MVGQIEIEIEAGQLATFLLLDLIDKVLGKQHSPFRMIRMRQRHEAGGKHVLFANIFGAHLGQSFPAHASAKLHAHAGLDGLATRHGYARGGTVAQVVTLLQQRLLTQHDGRFRRAHARHDAGKILLDDNRRVAG